MTRRQVDAGNGLEEEQRSSSRSSDGRAFSGQGTACWSECGELWKGGT